MNISVGDIITGTINAIKPYGIFITFGDDQIGFCHLSEISYNFVESIFDYCDIGQEVTAKIIEINTEKNRIAVSIKQTKEKPKPKKINKKSNNKDFDKADLVEDSFEVMLKKYKRQSDDTLQMLNRRGKKHTKR